MNISINITQEDLIANPDIIDGIKSIAAILKPESTEASKTEKPIKKKEKTVPEPEKPSLEPIKAEKLTPEPEHQYKLEDVRKALGDLSRSKGATIAKGLLKELDVVKVTDLPESKYPDLMKRIKEVG